MGLVKYIKLILGKIPGAADYYRYLRDSKPLKSKVVFRENLGFFFNGSESMQNGNFEPNETTIIEHLLENFDLFVNIGANTGYYVCKALKRGIATVAFEPNQLNVNILLKNIQANNFETEFQLFPVALSNRSGVLPMYGVSTGASLIKGWAGQEHNYLVPISTYDKTAFKITEGKKCLILIDIEGAELDCLKGANSLLESQEDNVFLVEITVSEHQPTGTEINPNLLETFTLMADHGYLAYTADSNIRQIELSEVSNIASTNVDTLGTHNFLFLKNTKLLNDLIF